MSLSNFPNGLTSFGQLVPGIGVMGNVYYVVNTTDTASYNLAKERFGDVVHSDGTQMLHTSIKSAYDATTTNRNDVIMIDAVGVHTLTTMLTVSKSRVHFVGMDGGDRYTEQGARIQTTVGAAAAAVIKVTGTRCSFRNIKFVQNDTNAAAINVAIMAGSSTLWKNCSFIFEVTNNLDETTAQECLIAEAGGTFDRCVFGNDCITSSASTGRAVTCLNTVAGSATGDSPKHNVFRDCLWRIQSSSANAIFFVVTAAKFTNTLINPVFHAAVVASTSAVTLTKALSVTSMGDGNILVVNPAANTTDLCTSSTNLTVVGMDMNGGTGTATAGVAVTPN